MKKNFILLVFYSPFLLLAQQNLPISFYKYEAVSVFDSVAYKEFQAKNKSDFEKKGQLSTQLESSIKALFIKKEAARKDSLHFRLYGIGNLSDETLKSLNAGGKLAVGFIPNPNSEKLHANYFVSFNKNASNIDSAISTMLVFPEAGNHSALLSVIWQKEKPIDGEKGLVKYTGPFFEFVFKKITNKKDTTDPKFEELSINTLHYTAGYRFGYSKQKFIEGKLYQIGANLSIFASHVNIPNEDHANFEVLTKLKATNNSFFLIGAKVSFELNGFQIFADVRHVFGDEKKLPLKDLKGFNSNVGVAFNTEVFRF